MAVRRKLVLHLPGAPLVGDTATVPVVAESLLIAGWVAMWRPLHIFLYEWWPILRRCRTLARLAEMSVDLRSRSGDMPS